MEKSLECSICLNDFIHPKLLPCLHTFCLKCLTKYCEEALTGDNKPCPYCRREFCISQGGVGKFENDEIVTRLLLARNLKEGRQIIGEDVCEICENAEANVKYFCVECKQKFCDRCKQLHLKQKSSENHRLVNVEDRPSDDELKGLGATYCQQHEKKEIELYCCDCNELLCYTCHATTHRNHACKTPSEIAKGKKVLVDRVRDSLQKCLLESKNKIDGLNQNESALLNMVSECHTMVEGSCSGTVQVLNDYANKLHGRFDEIKHMRMKEIQSEKDRNQMRHTELDSFMGYSRMVMERGTDCEIIRVADRLQKRAEELISSQDEYNKRTLIEKSVSFCRAESVSEEEVHDLMGRIQYKGEWNGRVFDVYDDVQAHFKGISKVIESDLLNMMTALSHSKSTDLMNKLGSCLIVFQNDIKVIKDGNEFGQTVRVDAQIFQYFNTVLKELSDNLAKSTNNASEYQRAREKMEEKEKSLRDSSKILNKRVDELKNKNHELVLKLIAEAADKYKIKTELNAGISEKQKIQAELKAEINEKQKMKEEVDKLRKEIDRLKEAQDKIAQSSTSTLKETLCGTLKILVVVGLGDGNSMEQTICHINLDKENTINTVDSTQVKIGTESAVCVLNNILYTVGVGSPRNQLWKWSPEEDVWTRLADMPSSRYRHCSTRIGLKIYVMGGWHKKRALDGILCYDVNTNIWALCSPLHHAVYDAACVTYNQSIYVFGGVDNNEDKVNYVQIYDIATDDVTVSPNPMPAEWSLMRAVVWESKALLIGCYTCYNYDFELKSWTERERFKTDLDHFGLTLKDDTLYISGGGIASTDGNNKLSWSLSNQVKSLSVEDFIKDNQHAVWKHHAELPQQALVQSFNSLPLYI